MEVLAHNCVSTSKEIHKIVHALVEAANLRCLESSICQHRLQRLKGPSMEVIVECWRVIKEILYAVDRVNAQAIHQALRLPTPQPSSRLVIFNEKVKNIIAISQNIQVEIQSAVDHRNIQYIQDYLNGMRLRQLKASCLDIRVECDRIIQKIFEATDRLDVRFIEQWFARHSALNFNNEQRISLFKPPHCPYVVRINLEDNKPSQCIESNGDVRTNLDSQETPGPSLTECVPGDPDDIEINNAPS